MPWATNTQFRMRGGLACPRCKSTKIVPCNDLRMEGQAVIQDFDCSDCVATWQTMWFVSGYYADRDHLDNVKNGTYQGD